MACQNRLERHKPGPAKWGGEEKAGKVRKGQDKSEKVMTGQDKTNVGHKGLFWF